MGLPDGGETSCTGARQIAVCKNLKVLPPELSVFDFMGNNCSARVSAWEAPYDGCEGPEGEGMVERDWETAPLPIFHACPPLALLSLEAGLAA